MGQLDRISPPATHPVHSTPASPTVISSHPPRGHREVPIRAKPGTATWRASIGAAPVSLSSAAPVLTTRGR
ncbi:hypothetical protein NL676_026123 [Syzygium grande]|nr:hypothetical protein NL676_026123 [Syzygium grande]